MIDKPKYMRDYMIDRYHVKMAEYREYLGGKCASCGSVNTLEIDHLDPESKSFSVGKGWSVPWERMILELAKCQLLCKPCHEVKTASQRPSMKHGTEHSYSHLKCRCNDCVEFWPSFLERRRAKRRNRTNSLDTSQRM